MAHALRMVGLEDRGADYPWRLSGGMAQRVQIARALALEPKVLLMDEPFGALDAITKGRPAGRAAQRARETDATVVFITHDLDEAIYLSDRVLVISGSPGAITLAWRRNSPGHEINWRPGNCPAICGSVTCLVKRCEPRMASRTGVASADSLCRSPRSSAWQLLESPDCCTTSTYPPRSMSCRACGAGRRPGSSPLTSRTRSA